MSGDKGIFNETAPLSRHGGEPSARRVSLIVYHLGGSEMVPLTAGVPVVVGREPPAQVVVTDRSLSRRHARFVLIDEEVIVEDLDSRNGTRVGGRQVTRDIVRPGTDVLLGAVTVAIHVFDGPGAAAGIPGHDWFRSMLEDELVRAKHFGRKLATLFVRAAGSDGHVSRWAPRIQAMLRPIDRLGLYSPQAVEVALPETTLEQAAALAGAIVQGRSTGEPPLFCGIAMFPEAGTTSERLIEVGLAEARAADAAQPVRSAMLEGQRVISATPPPLSGPIVQSAAMRELFSTLDRLGRSVIPVLIHGETGTGKEVVSRAIHESGPRRAGPLICVNCGAIPSQLVESTLFGHERGAFTGAQQQHRGVFESAEGGSVLLDEVGELPAAAQAALLRVLEAKRIVRVGGTREIEVDVRVLAATHRNLEEMCERGTFRTDLLYRLNALTLVIPPLRERADEIQPLAERFLVHANEANGRTVRGIAPDALELLGTYSWPGNIRELRNAIERAVVIARDDVITVDDLPDRVRAARPPAPATTLVDERTSGDPGEPADSGPGDGEFKARMQRYEVDLILDALRRANGNQTVAAQLLQMPLRTLKHKIKALGIRKLGFDAPK